MFAACVCEIILLKFVPRPGNVCFQEELYRATMEDISVEELQEFEAAAAAAQRQSTVAHLSNLGMPSLSNQRPNVNNGPPPPDDFDPFEEDVRVFVVSALLFHSRRVSISNLPYISRAAWARSLLPPRHSCLSNVDIPSLSNHSEFEQLTTCTAA